MNTLDREHRGRREDKGPERRVFCGISAPLEDRPILEQDAEVIMLKEGPGRAFQCLLHAPAIAKKAKPMQFLQVKAREGKDPFLRRPFSLSLIDSQAGIVGITWIVVGEGTEAMSRWALGQTVSIIGPLGNGFMPPHRTTRNPRPVMRLIAGGSGLAPMYPLASAALSKGWQVVLYYGARSAAEMIDTSPFLQAGCTVSVATEDGSLGFKGYVTGAVSQDLDGVPPVPKADDEGEVSVACGPIPMLRAAKTLFKGRGGDLYLSLEERMACGTGLCHGCAVKAAGSGYLHVCVDGPVFKAEDVDLGEGDGGGAEDG